MSMFMFCQSRVTGQTKPISGHFFQMLTFPDGRWALGVTNFSIRAHPQSLPRCLKGLRHLGFTELGAECELQSRRSQVLARAYNEKCDLWSLGVASRTGQYYYHYYYYYDDEDEDEDEDEDVDEDEEEEAASASASAAAVAAAAARNDDFDDDNDGDDQDDDAVLALEDVDDDQVVAAADNNDGHDDDDDQDCDS